jgi:flagellar motility protein MotE (MotC chaperone)
MAAEAMNAGMEPPIDKKAEKKRLKDERNKIKADRKAQKKEAKQRAKEISEQEAKLTEDEEAGGVSVFLVTVVIVIIWVAILCLLIKLDVGGFGSGVLAPILKDVPVVNKILPADSTVTTDDEESYGGYTSLQEAVDYIKELELQLEDAQAASSVDSKELEELRAENERLQTFEDAQVEFERIKTEFYEEVIYAENGPGAEEYQKYYQTMDPTTAEYLYKQVVQQIEADQEIKDYAQAYAEMKPKAAAAIFEEMTDDLDLAAKILDQMSAEDRGNILGAMDAEVAARLTRIMDPDD